MNPIISQSMGIQTKRYLETAREANDHFGVHVIGRVRLLGTALVGTVEVVARLASFLFGHVAGLFSLYRSPEIVEFLREQINAGFTASIVTSASLFSLLSPSLFERINLSRDQEVVERQVVREPDPEVQRVAELIKDIVSVPFQLVAFCFKLPFYIIYLQFQLGVVLPIRLMMLPYQSFVGVLNFEVPRDLFKLDLV